MFGTLTVNPEFYERIFYGGDKQRAFADYIQDLHRIIPDYNPSDKGSDIRYFCTVERGTHGGRHHFHYHTWMRDIPDRCKIDPSSGLQIPHRRRIHEFERLWTKRGFGRAEVISCRIDANDAWGRLHFRWPSTEQHENVPLKAKGIQGLCTYMMDYLAKQIHETPTRTNEKGIEVPIWRVKANDDYGKKGKLTELTKRMSNEQLQLMIFNKQALGAAYPALGKDTRPRFLGRVLPLTVLSDLCRTEYFTRMTTKHGLDAVNESLLSLSPQESLVRRLKRNLKALKGRTASASGVANLTRTRPPPSQSIGIFEMPRWKASAIYKISQSILDLIDLMDSSYDGFVPSYRGW